ncbi:RNA polymerase sigma factor [Streptomyces sp. NBC_00414]|uniref:RNA polymerase sigma factor n=1 Tax=Streptomyces sp. NBC_00414 TaxID=2975739 RepID=UPI002E223A69
MSTPIPAGTARTDEGFDAAFSELLPRLYRRSSQLTGGSTQAAEDAVHDTYLKLSARPRAFLDHPEPYAYAFRALLSVIRDRGRRERRLVPTAEVDPSGAAGWDGGVERRAAELDVLELLTELTPRQAGSVILVDLDGHTLDQAARILGVHRGTVARSRSRALDRLRNRIQERARREG